MIIAFSSVSRFERLRASSPLVEIFLAHAPTGTAVPEDRSGLERWLEESFETARKGWPDLPLTADQFMRHVAERLPAASRGQPLEDVLGTLHFADLYLSCACTLGLPGAADALDRHSLATLSGILRRHRYSPETIEDVCQKLREKLVLQTHISTYTGEGKLVTWVEVIAKRMANKEIRKAGSDPSGPSQPADALADASDLEKDVLKKNLLAELQSALSAAGSVLTEEQRELLKFHYRNGLSESKLAALFKTSQPTISRRLKSAREAIFNETRRRLRDRLGLAEREFDSFIADVQSRWLDLSLSHLFGVPDGSAPPSR